MRRGNVGGGFLDFCCRKKPPVGGRAARGRAKEGRGRGEGWEEGPGLLKAEGGGRGGRGKVGLPLFGSGRQGLGPGNSPGSAQAVSCPTRYQLAPVPENAACISSIIIEH